MTFYLKRGNTFNVTTKENLDIRETLPVGTYSIKQNPMTGDFYLEETEGYDVSGKLYGDVEKTADRVLSTFASRPSGTGILLSGEAGSGKTMLAKVLSVEGQRLGYPTILINQPWFGEEFNVFIQTIEQPTVIIFDEFEKVYSSEQQELLLTLLDGVYPSKKLFILTCNNKYRVNEHMKNRPGRIFYHLEYKGLDRDFVEEYCRDNLKDTSHTEEFLKIVSLFTSFNFDMLKALVEEVNRYGETPREAMRMLNAKPEGSEGVRFRISLFFGDIEISEEKSGQKEWEGNPLSGTIHTYAYLPNVSRKGTLDGEALTTALTKHLTDPFKAVSDPDGWDDDDDNYGYRDITFVPGDLRRVENDKFFYQNADGFRAVLEKKIDAGYNWAAF